MNLFHLSDLHASPDTYDELAQSIAVAREQRPDLYVISGDISDTVLRNTQGSRFPETVELIRSLADVAPVVMIYGTPTHDAAGSLDVFEKLDSKFGITVLRPGVAYFFGREAGDASARTVRTYPITGRDQALILGVPEPSKKHLMALVDTNADASKALSQALTAFFGALGVVRRQYPSIPCVLVYHGQVSGSRMSNGEQLPREDGRPSIDDLALVGADYIAAGDIHEPQKVGHIPFYYAGSAVPQNFGEGHDAGGNLVEIDGDADGWAAAVTRVSFGHPRRVMIKSVLNEASIEFWEIKGKMVKLEVRMPKESLAAFDVDAVLRDLIAAGAVPGSIVKPDPIMTETVRASEIQTLQTLPEKLKLWAEASNMPVGGRILEKSRQLEADAARDGQITKPRKIVLNRLRMVGAKGHWKKSRVAEIDLNLDAMEPGIICFHGPNGDGKTTTVESLQPWGQMLTRGGTFKSHFRVRESVKELYWTDETDGTKYLSKVTTNAGTASGTTEYFLFADRGNNGWEPVPHVEGRLEGYEDAIGDLFGSLDLYLRSAFVTQRQPKGMASLADSTPGQRKALFSELCGLGRFETLKGMAHTLQDDEQRKSYDLNTRADGMQAGLPDAESLRDKAAECMGMAVGYRVNLETVKNDGEMARIALDNAKRANEEQSRIAADLQSAVNTESEAGARITQANLTIESGNAAIRDRAGAEERIAHHGKLTSELTALDEAYGEHLKAREAEVNAVAELRRAHDAGQADARALYDRLMDDRRKDIDNASAVKRQAESTASSARSNVESWKRRVDELTAELAKPVQDSCPTCGQKLEGFALQTVHDELSKKNQRLVLLKQEVEMYQKELDEAIKKAELAEVLLREIDKTPIQLSVAEFILPPSTVAMWDTQPRANVLNAITLINVASANQTVQTAIAAEARNTELVKQIARDEDLVREARGKIADLRALVVSGTAEAMSAAETVYQAKRDLYATIQRHIAEAEADQRAAETALSEIASKLEAIEAIRQDAVKANHEAAEWAFLTGACGDKGIPALELDAASPAVSAIANELLRGTFGSRYLIQIDTTAMDFTGKRQLEVFEINVLDTETGELQELSTLSGGESVWIVRALYDAFALYRQQQAGLQFLTAVQDEADGQLDPAAKLTYFRMLETAHRIAGRRHTILITHSDVLQELIPQKITVKSLEVAK